MVFDILNNSSSINLKLKFKLSTVKLIGNLIFFLFSKIISILSLGKKIRFPINYTIDNLNFALRLLDDDKYNNTKILDLRIPNKVITYG